jgi:hypothetical protein
MAALPQLSGTAAKSNHLEAVMVTVRAFDMERMKIACATVLEILSEYSNLRHFSLTIIAVGISRPDILPEFGTLDLQPFFRKRFKRVSSRGY